MTRASAQKAAVRLPEGDDYRPLLRPETQIHTVDDLGELLYDASSGRYVRLGRDARRLMDLFDGRHTVGELAARAGEALGRPVADAAVRELVLRLGEQGMLAEGAAAFGDGGARRRIRRGFHDLLNIRFGFLRGERMLQAAARALNAVPAPAGRALVILLTLNGLLAPPLLAGGRLVRFALTFDSVTAPRVALVFALLLAELALHEFAHGVILTRFGGRVREFGVGLRYLFIAYTYTDTTDGYRLDLRRRVAVSLAGPFVDLALFGINAHFFRLLGPDSPAGHLLVIVMTCQVVILAFNINPLLPVDGYYVLADLLREPDLRFEAFVCLFPASRRLFGLPPSRTVTPRRRAIYLGYGILAALYLGVFVTYVFVLSLKHNPYARAYFDSAFPALGRWIP